MTNATSQLNYPAIHLKGVTFSYNGKDNILEDAHFCAHYGQLTLISGMSGKGKSTLVSIIAGIIPNITKGKLQGEVLVDNVDISGQSIGSVCRKVGIVLQNADQQIINRIVEDEIAFGCENLAMDRSAMDDQINTVCALLKLDKKDATHTLSGGQKQRLITASTLAMGQRIVILDEPLANLDKENAVYLLQLLRKLCDVGYCIIIVEHRLDMVLPYADVVWQLSQGKTAVVNNTQQYLYDNCATIPDICTTKPTEQILFDLQNVTYSVKGKQILKDINCTIPKGARVVLLGENGCGKTTLMRVVARLNKPTTGNIVTQSSDKVFVKRKASKKWFKKVGIVYQNPDYQLFMPTVRQEIEFGAVSKQYAMDIAQLFRLSHLLDRHPQSLSQGQKRRLSIAAVVATQPEVLLLDEPTVGQDYNGLYRLVDILNTLHQQTGNTIVTVTHDVRCAQALCDKALLMDSGKIVASGDKQLVKQYFEQRLQNTAQALQAK